jgi:hypothetical protein
VLQKQYITLICGVEVGIESFKVLVNLTNAPLLLLLLLVLVAGKEMGVDGCDPSVEVIC